MSERINYQGWKRSRTHKQFREMGQKVAEEAPGTLENLVLLLGAGPILMEMLWVGIEIMFKRASSMGGIPASMAPLDACDLSKHGEELEVTMGLSDLKMLLIEI